MSFLAELSTRLKDLTAGLRRRRAFGEVLQVEIAQDIVADVAGVQEKVARMAYTAEQDDRLAGKILAEVLADGRVTEDELPALLRAERHVRRSATLDQNISDALAT